MIESLEYETAGGTVVVVSPIVRPYQLTDYNGIYNLKHIVDPEDGQTPIVTSLPCVYLNPPPACDYSITPTGNPNEYQFDLTSNSPVETLTITNLDYGDGTILPTAGTITTHTYPSSLSQQTYNGSFVADDGENPPVTCNFTHIVPAINIAPICGYNATVAQTLISATSTATDPDSGPSALVISWELFDISSNLLTTQSGNNFSFDTSVLAIPGGTFTLKQTVSDGAATDSCIESLITSTAAGFTFECFCENN